MKTLETVTLELLRKGPAYNQLLSPVTEYLGLCGNFGATTVTIPWEHAQFILQARELYYPYYSTIGEDPDNLRRRQEVLNELAKRIAHLLGSIPGLAMGLNSCKHDAPQLKHLRLVISAAELSLLPFELSKNIAGIPGGQENWLSLQTTTPVCITRQVREVNPRPVDWPTKPNILFIAASPTGRIPLQSHTEAMLSAAKPWIENIDIEEEGDLHKKTGKIITFLTNANIERIETACHANQYTHIHVLAHGMEDQKTAGKPFGLALHDINNPGRVDVVTGKRFAKAICPLTNHPGPAVVTIASCNSGNVNSVVNNTGASFAHDLHLEGIPLVVASQFPLTFPGSVMMVEEIYGNLLWGENPFLVLHNLRTKLFTQKSTDNHDWASIVVYECLPEDLEQQLTDTAYKQTRTAINRILEHADDVIEEDTKDAEDSEETKRIKSDKSKKLVGDLFKSLDKVKDRFPIAKDYEAEIKGLQAVAEKRKAALFYKIHLADLSISDNHKAEKNKYLKKSYKALVKSWTLYKEAIDIALLSRSDNTKVQSSTHWLICQYLVLSIALHRSLNLNHWFTAQLTAETDVRFSKDQMIWAHGSLAELYLLLLAPDHQETPVRPAEAKIQAELHVRKIIEHSNACDFPIKSTKRQFARYFNWWFNEDFVQIVNIEKKHQSVYDFRTLISFAKKLHKILDSI